MKNTQIAKNILMDIISNPFNFTDSNFEKILVNLPKGEYIMMFTNIKVSGDETLEELKNKFKLMYWECLDYNPSKCIWDENVWAYKFLQSLFESLEINDHLVKHPKKKIR